MSDPLAAAPLPIHKDPAFVSSLKWRPSEPIIEADLDLLVDRLMEVDPEVCLQIPAGEEPDFVVSLGSAEPGYRQAATESVGLLLATTSALGIDAHIVEVDVCSGVGYASFDSADLVCQP